MTERIFYQKPLRADSKKVKRMLQDPDLVFEEKLDGYQFNFGLDSDGNLLFSSANRALPADDWTFGPAILTAQSCKPQLQPGWTYHCEYLWKHKQHKLDYARVPRHNLVVFDILDPEHGFLFGKRKTTVCEYLDLECAQVVREGSFGLVHQLLKTQSMLGGPIEGVVVKSPYWPFSVKVINPEFKDKGPTK